MLVYQKVSTIEFCSYPLVNIQLDPENNPFLVETNLPTPTTARVYVNLLEGISSKNIPIFRSTGFASANACQCSQKTFLYKHRYSACVMDNKNRALQNVFRASGLENWIRDKLLLLIKYDMLLKCSYINVIFE